MANGTNTTFAGNGSTATPFQIDVATASGTILGVVKEAATNAPVIIAADGSLGVNTANFTVDGEVTGPLNATVIADDVIDAANLQADAVETVKIKDNAVTPAKIEPGDTAGKILATTGTDPDLEASWVTPNSLVAVDNGLNKNATTDAIHLGGALIEATTITTSSTETLAITNLEAPTGANEIVVAETAAGVLRKVARSVSGETNADDDFAVIDIAGYNDYIQEVNISVTIPAATDINVVLPAASATNKGQVVNIKITNATEPDAYLNIKVASTVLTYGSMPYQGWVIKSDGANWVIVARN
jgi:hypothetical protein